MLLSHFDISAMQVQPYTLIFLKNDNHVLLIRRNSNKSTMPEKWLGLGGKVEKHESLEDSALREFYEESGLRLKNITLKGTFTWFDETNVIGVTHIFVSTDFTGNLIKNHREGYLEWHSLDTLDNLKGLAEYQHLFLSEILTNPNYFYSGIGAFNGSSMLSYAQNI